MAILNAKYKKKLKNDLIIVLYYKKLIINKPI